MVQHSVAKNQANTISCMSYLQRSNTADTLNIHNFFLLCTYIRISSTLLMHIGYHVVCLHSI